MIKIPSGFQFALATMSLTLILTGCQQSPPATTVVKEQPSSSERSTTTTESKEVSPAPNADPANPTIIESTTKKQTTTEKKQ